LKKKSGAQYAGYAWQALGLRFCLNMRLTCNLALGVYFND